MNVIVKINQTRFKANYKLMCHHLYSVYINVGKKLIVTLQTIIMHTIKSNMFHFSFYQLMVAGFYI